MSRRIASIKSAIGVSAFWTLLSKPRCIFCTRIPFSIGATTAATLLAAALNSLFSLTHSDVSQSLAARSANLLTDASTAATCVAA